jgi:hypothetical protein
MYHYEYECLYGFMEFMKFFNVMFELPNYIYKNIILKGNCLHLTLYLMIFLFFKIIILNYDLI